MTTRVSSRSDVGVYFGNVRRAGFLPLVLTFCWALWFGGLIALFLVVTSLFDTFAPDKALAGTAAAGVFRRFEVYQLVLAAVAVIVAAVWRASASAHRGAKSAVLVLVLLAAALAPAITFGVSRRIEGLRRERLTATPEFRRLHGISMGLYACEAALLLAAGLVLPMAVSYSPSKE